jgi:hypothetical protein
MRKMPKVAISSEAITPAMSILPSVRMEKPFFTSGEITTLPRTILDMSTKYLPASEQYFSIFFVLINASKSQHQHQSVA